MFIAFGDVRMNLGVFFKKSVKIFSTIVTREPLAQSNATFLLACQIGRRKDSFQRPQKLAELFLDLSQNRHRLDGLFFYENERARK